MQSRFAIGQGRAAAMTVQWIDSHCHLDAPEFALDRLAVLQRAQAEGVAACVMPAVQAKDFAPLTELARSTGQAYALGIHPLYVPQAQEADLRLLEQHLQTALNLTEDGLATDPRLVALGEIGLDFWVPSLCQPALREKQEFFYHAQLKLARAYDLPVILHVRKSADTLLKGLRQHRVMGGIAHAFNGSDQQAQQFIDMGFALGFGGAMTFDRALQLRHLASTLPLTAIVLETDAPDMPPHWLYRTQSQRQSEGVTQGRNEPCELPKIGAALAQLRGLPVDGVAAATLHNTLRVLPRLSLIQTASPYVR
jgi:TatD DNase family protein